MKSNHLSAAFIALIACAFTFAPGMHASARESGYLLLAPAEMRWQQWGSSQRIVLFGDAADFDCPYTDRVKFPAGFKVPEHSFTQDKEFTVISGVMHVGVGDKWDDSILKTLPAGSFWRIPANVSYFFVTEGEVVVQTSTAAAPGKDCTTKAAAQR